jgi:hypothetical protein
VDIYRPAIQNHALSAYAQMSANCLGAQPRTVRQFSLEEQRWFDKASGSQGD